MNQTYEEYLNYLEELEQILTKMTETAKNKIMAARVGDLVKVDECMKQEQAYSMSLRSMDMKRNRMLAELGLTSVTLSGLAEHYPPELRDRAAKTAERAMSSYEVYTSAANAARTTMECALRDIEKMFPENQPAPEVPPDNPPPRMKTDFRA